MSLGLLHRPGRRELRPLASIVGSYLTDGHRLFRVAALVVAAHQDVLVALEDCATLQVRACTWVELGLMQLRAVRGADEAEPVRAEDSSRRSKGSRHGESSRACRTV